MAFAYFDRVKETTTTTGVGVIALGGAVAGFQPFSAKYANNDTLHYTIFHAATGAWEVGLGTWATGNTLTRTTVLDSSNGGAAVNFAAGTKDVFVTLPAGVPSSMSAAFFSTTNSATRDAIAPALLRTGAVARLNSDGTYWIWNGAAWVAFVGFTPAGSAVGQTQIWNGTAWVAGALDLADTDAVTGKLPFGNIADGTGLSVFGRATNSTGTQASIVAANDFEVLRRSGTSIGFGTIATGGIGNSQVTYAKVQDGGAASVLGRSAGTSGVLADISSSADGQVLRRAGGVVGWGALDLADVDGVSGLLAFANIANGSARSVFGRSANSIGAMASIAGAGANTVLVDNGTALTFTTLALSSLTAIAAYSVVGNATAASAVPTAISGATDGQHLRRSGSAIGWGAVDVGVPASITGQLPFANIANGSPQSVLGRSANSTGVMASIGASADGQVLRSAAGVLGFGAVDLADVDAVTGLLPGTNVNPDFGAQTIITTGGARFGTNPSSSGSIRIANDFSLAWRNGTNSGDVTGFRVNSSDAIIIGSSAASSAVFVNSTASSALIIGASVEWGISQIRWDFNVATPQLIQEDDPTNGITGDVLLIQAQNATGATATGGDLQLRSGTGTTAAGATRLYAGGTLGMSVFTTGIDISLAQFGFQSSVVSPTFQQNTDSTAAVTGDQLTISAQNVSGTGATVGGAMLLRGGNSTNNVGGAIDLRSGAGASATQAGEFFLRIGSVAFLDYPGTVVPATTGIIRAYHSSVMMAGRDNANANNRNGIRWGITTDTWQFGDTTVATQLLGSSVQLGVAAGTMFEVATLATNREIISLFLGAAITTTQMPANTGDRVMYWTFATTVPTADPVGGWVLYSTASGYYARSPGGTVTQLAAN